MSQLAARGASDPKLYTQKGFFIMITHSTTSPSRHALVCRRWRAAVTTAALMLLTGSSLAYPVIAHAGYDWYQYDWCMNNLHLGVQYCCEQAGGVLSGGTIGGCGAPPTTVPPQTITQTPGPPILIPVPPP